MRLVAQVDGAASAVPGRARSSLCEVHHTFHGPPDPSGDRRSVIDERHHHRPVRRPCDEVGGPVQRIDEPGLIAFQRTGQRRGDRAGLLTHDRNAGEHVSSREVNRASASRSATVTTSPGDFDRTSVSTTARNRGSMTSALTSCKISATRSSKSRLLAHGVILAGTAPRPPPATLSPELSLCRRRSGIGRRQRNLGIAHRAGPDRRRRRGHPHPARRHHPTAPRRRPGLNGASHGCRSARGQNGQSWPVDLNAAPHGSRVTRPGRLIARATGCTSGTPARR